MVFAFVETLPPKNGSMRHLISGNSAGLAASKKRMGKIAADKPGPYFVFSLLDHLIVAVTDTTRRAATEDAA